MGNNERKQAVYLKLLAGFARVSTMSILDKKLNM